MIHTPQQPRKGVKNSCILCKMPDNEVMMQCDNRECNVWIHSFHLGLTEEGAQAMNWYCESCETRLSQTKEVCHSCKGPISPNLVVICNKKCGKMIHIMCGGSLNESNENFWTCADCKQTVMAKQTFEIPPTTSTPIKARSTTSQDKSPRNSVASTEKSFKSVASVERMNSLRQQKLETIRKQRELLEKEQALIDEEMENLTLASSTSDDQESLEDNSLLQRYLQEQSNSQATVKASKVNNSGIGKTNEIVKKSGSVHNKSHGANHKSTVSQNFKEITANQWAARQTMKKDLTIFSGKPEEWPAFIADFENSTEACGFTNQENLVRLGKSIKEPARAHVASMLATPECVPRIITTLRRLFAQPNQLYNTYMNKFKREPSPREHIPESILVYASNVQNIWSSIKATNLKGHMDNPIVMETLIEKLPQSLRFQWDTYMTEKGNGDMTTFVEWLDELSDKVCRINPNIDLVAFTSKSKPSVENKTNVKKERVHYQHEKQSDESNEVCLVCEKSCSGLSDCDKFKQMSQLERWNFIKSKGICKLCLKKHYLKPPHFNCSLRVGCQIPNCNGRHHTLIHRSPQKQTVNKSFETHESEVHHHLNERKLLFRFIVVKVRCKLKTVEIGAFMDEGSSGTFIDEDLARELGATGPTAPLCIHYTSKNHHFENDSMTLNLKIKANHSEANEFDLKQVQTVRDLSLSSQTLDYEELSKQYEHLKGIPVQSYHNLKPRLLIGLNNWKIAIPTEVRMGKQGEPIAAYCRLGWTVFAANTNQGSQSVHYCNYVNQDQPDEGLDKILKFHYSIESLGIKPCVDDVTSIEERRALDVMSKTMQRKEKNFEIGLLWKHDDIKLPNSYQMALNRLYCLEARMRKNHQLASAVHEQMQNMYEKGYARKIHPKELDQDLPRKWYLPVFPVVNPNKPGKVRNVFDAAAKSNGVSLNDVLLKGPDQNSSLLGILLRFRQNRIGIAADIQEMFMQVKIRNPDCYSQLFLYRESENDEIETCVLESMTFGATCSPTAAQFVKNSNAEKFQDEYPRAVQAIVKNHYVDDLLDSVDTDTEAIELIQQIRHIHSNANFNIRGWKSNSEEVMKLFGDAEEKINLHMEKEMEIDKVLGMFWQRKSDDFTYSLKFNKCNETVLAGKRKPTKIDVLRTLMSLYDPLGLLSHVTSILKVLMQDIWRSAIDWKDEIKEEHHARWLKWLEMLTQVENLSIPRCYLKQMKNWQNAKVQLHVFMDASRDCSAAVAYLRIACQEEVVVSIVMAKSKVAPIKMLSIPKLELVAAILGARISNTVTENLTIGIEEIFFWVDSITVLHWIRSDTKNIKGQFEKFRVAEIQDTTKVANWRYISTKYNVADDATKKNRSTINSEDRWFKGPSFLHEAQEKWPKDKIISNKQIENQQQFEVHTISHVKFEPVIKFERFSSWKKLVMVVALVMKFIKNIRAKLVNPKSKTPVSCKDLVESENVVFKLIQQEVYSDEIVALKQGRIVNKKSKIYHLSPKLIDGIICVEGRTQAIQENSPYANKQELMIPSETVNPIILPGNHYGTELLIRKYHEKYLHINHRTVFNEINQKFTIPGLWQRLKKIRRNCPRCALLNAKPETPKMGNLPLSRLAIYTAPFTYTGVDCLGPLNVTVRRRPEKRWVVLFTCMTVRAIHLEILHGMDHDSFILAFRCFTARRGQPKEMFSDNGTNFVKAERILREDMKLFNSEEIGQTMAREGIIWHFNPPEASHMGGVWERMVRSVKQAFYASMPSRSMSDPLLRSLLAEIENMINSRPLTYLPLENENSPSLTPNHFLLGSSNGAKPIGVFDDNAKLLKSNWLNSQLYTKIFWKRWILEYLPTITRRTKWFEPKEPLKEGDLVLLVDTEKNDYHWQRGRIETVKKSADGQVRSVVVKTSTGFLTRPVVKVAKLDLQLSEPESLRDQSGHRGECYEQLATLNVKNQQTIGQPWSNIEFKRHLESCRERRNK